MDLTAGMGNHTLTLRQGAPSAARDHVLFSVTISNTCPLANRE